MLVIDKYENFTFGANVRPGTVGDSALANGTTDSYDVELLNVTIDDSFTDLLDYLNDEIIEKLEDAAIVRWKTINKEV